MLDDCNVNRCTSPRDVTCAFCKGEWMADQLGANEFTGEPDRKQCRSMNVTVVIYIYIYIHIYKPC